MKSVCALLSGGKDSNYALYKAIRSGYRVSCILVVRSRTVDSWMFHVPHVDIALLQARAMGYQDRVHMVEVSGVKEREVEELYDALRNLRDTVGFDAISVGALASMYQYNRISWIASRLGVEVYAPHWLMDQEEYLRMLVKDGIVFIITRISTMGLPHRLLGRPIGYSEVEEIIEHARRYGFNPAFEGGEAETLVIDAPHYKSRLLVKGRPRRINEFEAELVIEDVGLMEKTVSQRL